MLLYSNRYYVLVDCIALDSILCLEHRLQKSSPTVRKTRRFFDKSTSILDLVVDFEASRWDAYVYNVLDPAMDATVLSKQII